MRIVLTTFLVIGAGALVLGQITGPWYFELFSHFQLQYTILFILLFFTFLYLKERGRALLSLFFLLVSLSFLSPYLPTSRYVSAEDVVNVGTSAKRLMYYNMWVGNTNYDEIVTMVKDEDPDVLIIAEVAGIAYKSLKERLSAEYPYSDFQTGPTAYLDLAYFSKEAPVSTRVVFSTIKKIPALRLVYEISGKRFVVYGVHTSAPLSRERASARDEQLGDLAVGVSGETIPTVLIGDLNITPFSPIFRKFSTTSGLNEARAGRGLMQSWSETLPAITRIPIDHALVSEGVEILQMHMGDPVGSDHRPVILEVTLSQ